MATRRPAESSVNPARGIALVVAAVLIGLFLIRYSLDSSENVESKEGSPPTTAEANSGKGTTTTTVALRPPADVPTIVLNGSGVTGAAKVYSTTLSVAGYRLTNPAGANADGENVTTTQVFFAPGFEGEAAAVAAAIGAPAIVPAALPAVPPGQIAGASVVVVLGSDLGSVTPVPAPAT